MPRSQTATTVIRISPTVIIDCKVERISQTVVSSRRIELTLENWFVVSLRQLSLLFPLRRMIIDSSTFDCQGQLFAGPDFRVYLLGNPVIWWSCLVVLSMFVVTSVCVAVVSKHRSTSPAPFLGQFQFVSGV